MKLTNFFKSLALSSLVLLCPGPKADAGIFIILSGQPVLGAAVIAGGAPVLGAGAGLILTSIGYDSATRFIIGSVTTGLGLGLITLDSNQGDLESQFQTRYPELNEIVVAEISRMTEEKIVKATTENQVPVDQNYSLSLNFSSSELAEIEQIMDSFQVSDELRSTVLNDLK